MIFSFLSPAENFVNFIDLFKEWLICFIYLSSSLFLLLFVFDKISWYYGAQKDSKFWSSCLQLPNAEMICVHPHAWFTRCWALNTELVHAGRVLSQLSCSSSRYCVWVGIQWFLLLFSLALLFNAAVSLLAWLQLCPKDLCLLDFYFPSVSYCLMCPLRLLCLMDY